MEKNNILMAVAAIVGVFVFIGIAYFITSKPQESYFPELAQVAEGAHTKWSDKNELVLVEYSDFQCPGCGQYYGAIKAMEQDPEVGKTLMDNITFVYKHFPLENIHPNARAAAQAAEAAGKQGKFFEMHDLLFANQNEWSESGDPKELFNKYAEQLELDMEQFQTDSASSEVNEKIQADMISGNNFGVPGTPTFFLNGQRIQPSTFEEFQTILLEAVENNSAG